MREPSAKKSILILFHTTSIEYPVSVDVVIDSGIKFWFLHRRIMARRPAVDMKKQQRYVVKRFRKKEDARQIR